MRTFWQVLHFLRLLVFWPRASNRELWALAGCYAGLVTFEEYKKMVYK